VPLNNGQFALGQDDEGHIGGGNTEAWAIDDPVLKLDFGYLSEHVFAVAAKAIIASYYGSAPKYSYYDGCSDGGREALMEAQRFPRDFNGIIAGAPAFNQAALNAMEEPYESTADATPAGQPILTAAKSAVLHDDIISQCADPGLRDGTIQDPRDCQPDWPKIQCPAGATDTTGCLTAAEVAAAKRLYTGAVAPTASTCTPAGSRTAPRVRGRAS
jgi:feruloyl esterase